MANRNSKTGFTLIELVVSIGILALMIGFSSVIFKFSIDAHRIASANAEIMQKARAITGQLNRDFRGLRKDAPMFVKFLQSEYFAKELNRYDQIMFFADGDFSSWRTYNDKTVRGNTARIFYGHVYLDQKDPVQQKERETLALCLARSAHILTQDSSFISWFNADTFGDFSRTGNGEYEYDRASLAQWQLLDTRGADGAMVKNVILNTFRYDPGPTEIKTPEITLENLDPDTLHKLLAQGIGSFSVQIAYWEKNNNNEWELRWFPSHNPSGNMNISESHFGGTEGEYGLLFNLSAPIDWDREWFNSIDSLNSGKAPDSPLNGTNGTDYIFKSFPDAMKFTFKIYDSRGIIKGGRTFTHIVYLND